MKLSIVISMGGALALCAWAAETKVKMADLPPAVQAAVKEQTKNSTLVGLAKEVEKGKTLYEAETKVNGKTRDISFDSAGKIVSVEEEVDISSIPAAARTAIEKKAAGAKIKLVETVTEGGKTWYEAAIEKGGKSSEFVVNADGSVHK
jgi:uncharacterized membrane protein YkoI